MNDARNGREQLDALLTGLEDEVISTEPVLFNDVDEVRSAIDRLIEMHAAASGRQHEALHEPGDAKGRVASAMELLGRWAGIGQGAARRVAAPRVRMAFSGRREEREHAGRSKGRSEGRGKEGDNRGKRT